LDWDHDEGVWGEDYVSDSGDDYDQGVRGEDYVSDSGEDYDEKYGRYDKFERESFNRRN